MNRRIAGRLAAGLTLLITTFASLPLTAQDLFVQVELGGSPPGCSILRVAPDGTLTEWVSNADILAATGETDADCDDTGMAVAPDGTLYFAEDTSHDILTVTPTGAVSVFVDSAVLDAAVGTSSDIDNGMVFGSDGNLYAADEDCDCIIRITVPGGVVTIEVSNADILAHTGKSTADLEGGLARASDGTLYFVDEDSQAPGELVLTVSPGGVISTLATESDITAVTGNSSTDLDVGIALGSALFVLDDGAGDGDNVLRIDVGTGAVSLIADEAAIGAANGNTGTDPADVEGGIAIHPATGDLFVGDDGTDTTDGEDKANIMQITQAGSVSVFVTDTEVSNFYAPLYPSLDPRFRGSMVFGPPPAPPEPFVIIPTLNRPGLALLVMIIGVLGALAGRRILN